MRHHRETLQNPSQDENKQGQGKRLTEVLRILQPTYLCRYHATKASFPITNARRPTYRRKRRPGRSTHQGNAPPPHLLYHRTTKHGTLKRTSVLPDHSHHRTRRRIPNERPQRLPLHPKRRVLRRKPKQTSDRRANRGQIQAEMSQHKVSPTRYLRLCQRSRQDHCGRKERGTRRRPDSRLSKETLQRPRRPRPKPPQVRTLYPINEYQGELPPRTQGKLRRRVYEPTSNQRLLLPRFPRDHSELRLHRKIRPLRQLSMHTSPLKQSKLRHPAYQRPSSQRPKAITKKLRAISDKPNKLHTRQQKRRPTHRRPLRQTKGKGRRLSSTPTTIQIREMLLRQRGEPRRRKQYPPTHRTGRRRRKKIQEHRTQQTNDVRTGRHTKRHSTTRNLQRQDLRPTPPLLLRHRRRRPTIPTKRQ